MMALLLPVVQKGGKKELNEMIVSYIVCVIIGFVVGYTIGREDERREG